MIVKYRRYSRVVLLTLLDTKKITYVSYEGKFENTSIYETIIIAT